MKTCFIVCPIGNEGTDVRKRADQLFRYIISPVCEKCGLDPIRVDQLNQADAITQTIIDYLKNAELVIADMTGHNPNAFYEIGYRASTGKPIIHIKQKDESIPFDIANIRTFDYDLTDLDSVDEVKERLEKTIIALDLDMMKSNHDNEDSDIANTDKANSNLQILQGIYQIQDQIAELIREIHIKDTETIQAIVKASQPVAPAESAETALIKAILPELMKNPNSMKTLMEIGEMSKKR